MSLFFKGFLTFSLSIGFSIYNSQFNICFTKNHEESNYIENVHQSTLQIYQQKNMQNQINNEEKDSEDKLSTLQTLLIIIPLLMIPTTIIIFVFYKKFRNHNQIKKEKNTQKKQKN